MNEPPNLEIEVPSYPCVGTVGRGVFALTIDGEAFRGVVRIMRRGTLENSAEFFAEVLDKNDFQTTLDEWPAAGWWDCRWDDTPTLAPKSRTVSENGGTPNTETDRVVSLATESDYYGRILPLLRRLES